MTDIMEDLLFDDMIESLKPTTESKLTDLEKEFRNVAKSLSPEEVKKRWDECSTHAISLVKSGKKYAKAVAIKGNAKIDAEINKVISEKKYKTMNLIAKGATKTIIISMLVGALIAAIVIPGGFVAAGGMVKAI